MPARCGWPAASSAMASRSRRAITAGADLGSSGDAGGIQVSAGTIELRDGGSISGSTRGLGDGGGVSVDADQVTIGGSTVLAGRPLVSGIRRQCHRWRRRLRRRGHRPDQAAHRDAGRRGGQQYGRSRRRRARSGRGHRHGRRQRRLDRDQQHLERRGGRRRGAARRGCGCAPTGWSARPARAPARRAMSDATARRLEVQDAALRTAGTGAEGGRIDVARRRPDLSAPQRGDLERHRARSRAPA